jgi:hypothetical protein
LSEIKSEAKDMFSYILVFCPNFPPATGATTKTTFEKQIGFIEAILERTKGDEAKQWLRICLQEVRQSWKSYEDGNLVKGKDLIQQAEKHFKNAFSKKPIEARFVAGESGAAFDSEKGFPEQN